ncbi:hypothetical protein R1flu_015091 [Riccia fluitans]|uniref:Uncharacterized protein n=1 Tax=Riccia fluitans TaxID=41844 RepID=A0ABD1YIC6_9MARC
MLLSTVFLDKCMLTGEDVSVAVDSFLVSEKLQQHNSTLVQYGRASVLLIDIVDLANHVRRDVITRMLYIPGNFKICKVGIQIFV